MSSPAINSALEAADWFFKRAERDGLYLENDKGIYGYKRVLNNAKPKQEAAAKKN